MRTRAWRRAQNKRVKNKFYHILKKWGWWSTDIENYARERSKFYNTRCPCSCYMCGNPRKLWKDKTIQEKKFDELARDSEVESY